MFASLLDLLKESLAKKTWYTYLTKVGWIWTFFLAVFLSEKVYRERLAAKPHHPAAPLAGRALFELLYAWVFAVAVGLMAAPQFLWVGREPFFGAYVRCKLLRHSPMPYAPTWLTIWDWLLLYAPVWFLLGRARRPGGVAGNRVICE